MRTKKRGTPPDLATAILNGIECSVEGEALSRQTAEAIAREVRLHILEYMNNVLCRSTLEHPDSAHVILEARDDIMNLRARRFLSAKKQ